LNNRSKLQVLWKFLSNNRFEEVDFTTGIADVFKNASALQNLDISNNNIEDAGAMAIAEAMKFGSTLQ